MPDRDDNLYNRAGIYDRSDFYRTKFVSDEVLDARYFKALDRFDIRFARTMWIYDNVRAGSSVLDLGCGAGMLALLKRKGVTLTGVDLSSECSLAARRNGYDATVTSELTRLPFPGHSFDYVVSLDVLGHVGFEEKDAVLAEIKRVLRPDGVTMHGIECIDRAAQRNYDELSAEELRRFVDIDGHVGLEEEQEHGTRFLRLFKHVAWEPRYALCLSSEEFIKQADKYGLSFESDFLDYLRGLSFRERRAFDIAMGYVFGKISDLDLSLPKSGLYVFLKASDKPLRRFYNEHRDRRGLYPTAQTINGDSQTISLDRDPDALFDDGWYEPNMLPPVARWMSKTAKLIFSAPAVSRIEFDLTTHMPELCARPLTFEVLLNGFRIGYVSMFHQGWLELSLAVPDELSISAADRFELELRADRTWQPRPGPDETRDDRELSVAICNIVVTTVSIAG